MPRGGFKRGGRGGRGGKKFHSSNGNRKDFNKNNRGGKNQFGKREYSQFTTKSQNQEAEERIKRQRLYELSKQEQVSSSESEEEAPDAMKQLLSTFSTNDKIKKKSAAIESSEDSEGLESDEVSDLDNSEDNLNEEQSDFDDNETLSDVNAESDDDLDSNNSENEEEADIEQSDSSLESGDDEDLDSVEDTVDSDDISFVDGDDNVSDKQSELIENKPKTGTNSSKKIVYDTLNNDKSNENDFKVDEELPLTDSDPFCIHLDHDINSDLLNSISEQPPKVVNHELNWPELGRMLIEIPTVENQNKKQNKIILDDDVVYASLGTVPEKLNCKKLDFEQISLKMQLRQHISTANAEVLEKYNGEYNKLTPLQAELFSVMNNYQDLYHSGRTLDNGEEIRLSYCLHSLNHVLKTRTKVLHHNSKILRKDQISGNIPDQFRDQGLVRPKVLIIVPFRDSALKVVNMLISLLVPGGGERVHHSARLKEEYGGPGLLFPKKNPKPEDYEKMFQGNTDDNFRLGISVTKKSIKLYADYYASDIIVASPLGLRAAVGAPGEAHRDFDFLSSLELMILDQADIFLAQNWDHLMYVLDHVHLQPKEDRGTDYSRVRSWSLNGWSKYYRQTILLTSHDLPEFRSLFNRRCYNYRGKVRTANTITNGTIRQVAVTLPQVFHRISADSVTDAIEKRFKHFIQEVLPQFQGPAMAQSLLYIPSYFDYVRIRNYFKKEDINFVQICEYSKDSKVARARDMFYHGTSPLLLYSERAHFFKRTRVKGIRHIIMYQPPTWPHFYSEMCNFMQEANQNPRTGVDTNMTVTVLYSNYDILQLAAIVGSERASHMSQSKRNVHMFMTGE